jgi:hypothetical protein
MPDDKSLRELLVSSEVQTARQRLEDYDVAEAAVFEKPEGQAELSQLREALGEMPGGVRMLLDAIERAAVKAGETSP